MGIALNVEKVRLSRGIHLTFVRASPQGVGFCSIRIAFAEVGFHAFQKRYSHCCWKDILFRLSFSRVSSAVMVCATTALVSWTGAPELVVARFGAYA